MKDDVPFSETVDRLLATMPELRATEYHRDWEVYCKDFPLADPLYADVLAAYIWDIVPKHLQGDEVAGEFVQRAFSFLEVLATSTDFNTRCLVAVSFLESLLGERDGYDLFTPFMGPATKAFADALAERWRLGSEKGLFRDLSGSGQ
jgi:hypothetical protein